MYMAALNIIDRELILLINFLLSALDIFHLCSAWILESLRELINYLECICLKNLNIQRDSIPIFLFIQ
jgi:hypothetical protein